MSVVVQPISMIISDNSISLVQTYGQKFLQCQDTYINWYEKEFASFSGLPFSNSQIAGVVSALSPTTAWSVNVSIANNFLSWYGNKRIRHRRTVKNFYNHCVKNTLPMPRMSKMVEKCLAIVEIDHPVIDVVSILAKQEIKTPNFYLSFLGYKSAFCIDRHIIKAFDLSNSETISPRRYLACKADITTICSDLGIVNLPKFQAFVWESYLNFI